jgi:hypothetical protein
MVVKAVAPQLPYVAAVCGAHSSPSLANRIEQPEGQRASARFFSGRHQRVELAESRPKGLPAVVVP